MDAVASWLSGDAASWISVLLTILGLGGGGVVGARKLVRARTILEDRRSLLTLLRTDNRRHSSPQSRDALRLHEKEGFTTALFNCLLAKDMNELATERWTMKSRRNAKHLYHHCFVGNNEKLVRPRSRRNSSWPTTTEPPSPESLSGSR